MALMRLILFESMHFNTITQASVAVLIKGLSGVAGVLIVASLKEN